MQEAPNRPHGFNKRLAGFVEEKLSALLLNDDYSINYQSVTDSLVRRYFKDLDSYFSSSPGPDGQPNNAPQEIRERLIRILEKHNDDRILLVAAIAGIPYAPSPTKHLAIHGWKKNAPVFGTLASYGFDAYKIEVMMNENPKLGKNLHKDLPISKAMVVLAARNEMAQTVEDVLARRTRCLLLAKTYLP